MSITYIYKAYHAYRDCPCDYHKGILARHYFEMSESDRKDLEPKMKEAIRKIFERVTK